MISNIVIVNVRAIGRVFLAYLFLVCSTNGVALVHPQTETDVMPSNKQKVTPIQFSEPSELKNWIIVNDTVMGGLSSAKISRVEDFLVFEGNLSLQNNGGFASTRRVNAPYNWQANQAIEIRFIGDGRSYQFRLRTGDDQDDHAYVANFNTQKNVLQTRSFTLNDFTAQYRGRVVRDAPALSFDNVKQLGFMIADKKSGEFTFKVQDVRQIDAPKP